MITQLGIGGSAAQLVLPSTSMNLSGQVVSPLMKYFGVPADGLLVVHDDIDLPFGRLRVQVGRGAGGHNGVASVIKSVGTAEFWRLKIGVGRPPGAMDPAAYVLRRFTTKERPNVDVMIVEAVDLIETYLEGGPEVARQASGEKGPM